MYHKPYIFPFLRLIFFSAFSWLLTTSMQAMVCVVCVLFFIIIMSSVSLACKRELCACVDVPCRCLIISIFRILRRSAFDNKLPLWIWYISTFECSRCHTLTHSHSHIVLFSLFSFFFFVVCSNSLYIIYLHFLFPTHSQWHVWVWSIRSLTEYQRKSWPYAQNCVMKSYSEIVSP